MSTDVAQDLDRRPTLAEQTVVRLGDALAGRSLTRRRVLFRLAVVATALLVDPVRYILRPGSAYAAVCGDGATCTSGWAVFCCTINDGANLCPQGSYAAGWWKVDASAFCRGAARYYVDCNREPDASCTCRCNDTGCDRRRTCCNNFRYGQCNTHVRGTTEVVCRVVTCTAPWEWDPACSTSVRTENATRTHSAGCLPGTDASDIELVYLDLGLTGSPLGRPEGEEVSVGGGARQREYEHGVIVQPAGDDPIVILDPLATAWLAAGGVGGQIGAPRGPATTTDGGHHVLLTTGGLVVLPAGASQAAAIWGPAAAGYLDAGGVDGPWGLPTSGTRLATATVEETRFSTRTAYGVAGVGLVVLHGAILLRYRDLQGPGGELGAPTGGIIATLDGRRRAGFERGAILHDPDTGTVTVVRRSSGRDVTDLPLTDPQPPATGRPVEDLP